MPRTRSSADCNNVSGFTSEVVTKFEAEDLLACMIYAEKDCAGTVANTRGENAHLPTRTVSSQRVEMLTNRRSLHRRAGTGEFGVYHVVLVLPILVVDVGLGRWLLYCIRWVHGSHVASHPY